MIHIHVTADRKLPGFKTHNSLFKVDHKIVIYKHFLHSLVHEFNLHSNVNIILQNDNVCQNVDVPPDKGAAGLTKSQVLEYIVDDYKTLTELIMAGQQYCYYIYLNRTYQCDRNINCLGICDRLLNQSRTVAAETRRIVSTQHTHTYIRTYIHT